MSTFAPPQIERDQETRDKLTPVYNVVLLDDDDHTYDYFD